MFLFKCNESKRSIGQREKNDAKRFKSGGVDKSDKQNQILKIQSFKLMIAKYNFLVFLKS